jgi:hypothetical protein
VNNEGAVFYIQAWFLFHNMLHNNGRLNTSAELLARTTRRGLFLLSKSQSAQLVYKRVALLHTTWYTAVAGWNVKAWVPSEKVARPEQQCHRLSRHDWEIFWTWEMGDAKGVPENNVRVGQIDVRVRFDPRRNTLRRLARCLRYVTTGRMELCIVI